MIKFDKEIFKKALLAGLIIAFSSWLAGQNPRMAGFIIALPMASLIAIVFFFKPPSTFFWKNMSSAASEDISSAAAPGISLVVLQLQASHALQHRTSLITFFLLKYIGNSSDLFLVKILEIKPQ